MAFITDSYDLNYGTVTVTGTEADTASLVLQASTVLPLELFGYVYNTTEGGTPIVNALVMVYDVNDNIIDTTYTDGSGYYSFTTLSAGNYQVNSSSPGFTASDFVSVALADVPLQQDIVLQPYSDNDRVIFGTITDLSLNPISGARIDIVDNVSGDVIASTTSIVSGAYAVYDLADGTYTVIATVSGYSAGSGTATISDTSTFMAVDLSLNPYTQPAEGGSISGFITDASNNPLEGAWVGLADSTGMVIETTFTNNSGYYIFNNVSPGDYFIKSKMQN